jgi:hypothetical protein
MLRRSNISMRLRLSPTRNSTTCTQCNTQKVRGTWPSNQKKSKGGPEGFRVRVCMRVRACAWAWSACGREPQVKYCEGWTRSKPRSSVTSEACSSLAQDEAPGGEKRLWGQEVGSSGFVSRNVRDPVARDWLIEQGIFKTRRDGMDEDIEKMGHDTEISEGGLMLTSDIAYVTCRRD